MKRDLACVVRMVPFLLFYISLLRTKNRWLDEDNGKFYVYMYKVVCDLCASVKWNSRYAQSCPTKTLIRLTKKRKEKKRSSKISSTSSKSRVLLSSGYSCDTAILLVYRLFHTYCGTTCLIVFFFSKFSCKNNRENKLYFLIRKISFFFCSYRF